MKSRPRPRLVFAGALFALACWSASPAGAEDPGVLAGTATAEDGTPLAGAEVSVEGSDRRTVTDAEGRFSFEGLAPGRYTVHIAVEGGDGNVQNQIREMEVVGGHFAETLTVVSASRRAERIVDAPAAITALTHEEIERQRASGQLPKLLEYTVGVEIVQNGLYDFNLNTRGFNSPLSRRIQVRADGRDPGIPFLSSQEWALVSFLAGDLERVELVRGPSAALYGANSFNGVLNLVTTRPSASRGGTVRGTFGDLSTTKLDLRWAGRLAEDWFFKVVGEHNESDDFTRSRNVQVEYPGLELEVIPLPFDGHQTDAFQARADWQVSDGALLSLEAGFGDGAGQTMLTSTGRSATTDVERSWARVNFNTPRWNLLGYRNARKSEQVFLNAAFPSVLDDDNLVLEVQGNLEFSGGRGRLVGGASYGEENVDTAGPDGVQTLVDEPISSDEEALFAQLDYDLSDRWKVVLAARWDDSSLHDSQLSPKGSLVFSPGPRHTLRLSYNDSFQVGNYAQLFLSAPAGAPLDLSAIEDSLAPLLGGVPLGLGFVPVVSLGNPHQDVETIRGLELGYSAILGERAYLTVDVYRNRLEDFLGDLTVGVNPDFGPYRAPAALAPEAAAVVEGVVNGLVPGISNNAAGNPLFVLSFANSGKVDTAGVEVSLHVDLGRGWAVFATGSWFDFDVKGDGSGFVPLPNAPETKLSAGVSYARDRLSASLRYRWADSFEWESGLFAGTVPSYGVVSLAGSYDLSERWRLGTVVSNLLDDEHYEVFGGDVLERRALGYVSFSW